MDDGIFGDNLIRPVLRIVAVSVDAKRMGRHHWLLNQIYQVNRVSMKRARTPEESVPDHPTPIALMQDKPHANLKAEFARYGFTWDRS
mmetsp:Transcript_4424/g.7169  ORF Transcript_4424/g.7169 Transcript_4424/m.7169 type:complete len:88 (+) Transcript_4424:52-315(+)